MIKMIATINNRRTLFLGLERTNTDRLHDDQPIPIDLQAMLATTDVPDVQDIVLLAGETLAEVYAQLAEGIPGLPPFQEPVP